MATTAYHRWVADGRPWELARPIRQLQEWAQATGVPVLGTIGNEAHLQADWPEDHTPFSATAWPTALPGYVVTAIDLADVDGLGWAILTQARAGELPWLKYFNFAEQNFTYADGFVHGWPNADQHIHISIFSDETETSILPFDPWGDDDMPTAAEVVDELLAREVPSVDGDPVPVLTLWRHAQDKAAKGWREAQAANARLDAITEAMEGLAPGVAQAAAEAVARVSAEDVAAELEIRPRGST